MFRCHACTLLPTKTLAERAKRLIWWRFYSLPSCPTAKSIREIIARPAGAPEILGSEQAAERILEDGVVPLGTTQQTPPVMEPIQLLPLEPYLGEEVTEEAILDGTGISLVKMIRAEGATQLPIGHGLVEEEEEPQAHVPTEADRDSSSNHSVDDESSSSSSSSRSSSPIPQDRVSRPRVRSSSIQQQIQLDAVIAKHMQLLEDSFAKRFDRIEQDVRNVSQASAALGAPLNARAAPAATVPAPLPVTPLPVTVPAANITLSHFETQGQDTSRKSMQDRVAAWLKPTPPPKTPIPRVVRATKPNPNRAPSIASFISDDSPMVGSEHAWRPTQLREGMSEYDWDNQGTRVQVREDLASAITKKVDELVRVVGSISEVLGFAQEPEPTVQPDLQPFGVLDQPKSSKPNLPLPHTMRDIWSEARKTRAGKPIPLVPAAVRASYRLPPDDWAFFGAVRRA